MNNLVTDAAVEAARKGQGCEELDGCDCVIWITDGLNAAAKLIAAEALRQVAQKVYDRFNSHMADDAQTIVYTIARMADDLERE